MIIDEGMPRSAWVIAGTYAELIKIENALSTIGRQGNWQRAAYLEHHAGLQYKLDLRWAFEWHN